MFRGALRQNLIGIYFPDRRRELRAAARFDVWANPIANLVCWLGMLGSLFGRCIQWRGIRYRVALGGRVLAVQRDEEVILPLVRDKAGQPTHVPAEGDPTMEPRPVVEPRRYRKVG
ncbi:MAG: hypothetical protein A2V70_16720 [Planctomycetes bacterium RBG_13_63_9]|nr:MAG: hypothetical protein A2V70_16720 [Planctomycetes bacterium RBG_13_63_9]